MQVQTLDLDGGVNMKFETVHIQVSNSSTRRKEIFIFLALAFEYKYM